MLVDNGIDLIINAEHFIGPLQIVDCPVLADLGKRGVLRLDDIPDPPVDPVEFLRAKLLYSESLGGFGDKPFNPSASCSWKAVPACALTFSSSPSSLPNAPVKYCLKLCSSTL